ncbi:lysylphosphatidylglycerol synthase transmembrane domain-containing protein [Arthrobacter sp. 08Y14]|uniref:lysylphosphatidylglycerol synthase transmembrane domain-containing protein n=1 Tax=Arthrobacter sp. 08Y14 TaxID=2058885 RepID=UPI000CE45850|nr:lysylphosphatidylglycerol synthase transmembrane domain-containing protein [Arthrobacter sp. 08Y14]
MLQHLHQAWRRVAHSRLLRWAAAVLAVVLVIEYIVLPQLAGSGNIVSAVLGLPAILILLAVCLETGSLASYSWLTREVLPGEERPGFFTLFRIDLADLAVNHTVPGGGTTSAAARFRLLTRCGVQSENALSAATVQVVGANLVLAGLFSAGLLTVHSTSVAGRYLSTAGAVVLVLLVLSVAVLTVLDRHLDGAVRIASSAARTIRVISPASAEQFVRTIAAEVQMFRRDPRRFAAAVVLAALRYVLDAACLWVFLAAYGHVLHPAELLLAYSLANLVALAPLTPGGLGLVEGVLVPMLVAFGAPDHAAVLGVLSWRLVQFWLPIPAGGLAYLSLRLGILRRKQKQPRNKSSGAASTVVRQK